MRPETAFAHRALVDDDPLPMGALPFRVTEDLERLLMVMAGGARFGEPTYDESIRKLSAGGVVAGSYHLPIDRLIAETRSLPAPAAGVIFHVGRCGSTLVSRMLAVDPSLCVFSEPDVWSHLDHLASSVRGPERLPATAPEACLRLFGRFAADRGQQLVLKPTSWQVQHAATTRASLATPRSIFLFRDPAEVVASNLAVRPGFDLTIERDLRAEGTVIDEFLPGIDRDRLLEPTERFAELWRCSVDAALDLDDLLLVPYPELVAEPARTLERIVEHLGLERFPFSTALAQRDFYAKASQRSERYEPGGAHRRAELDAAQRAAVDAITGSAQIRLRERAEAHGA